MSVVIQHLEAFNKIMQNKHPLFSLLLKLGKHFECADYTRPLEMEQQAQNQCFSNCAGFVFYGEGYVYCEGYAVIPSVGFPVHHAWLLNAEGKVIDPTWDDLGSEYFGIAFKEEYVRKAAIRSGMYSVLDNWKFREFLTDSPELYVYQKPFDKLSQSGMIQSVAANCNAL